MQVPLFLHVIQRYKIILFNSIGNKQQEGSNKIGPHAQLILSRFCLPLNAVQTEWDKFFTSVPVEGINYAVNEHLNCSIGQTGSSEDQEL